MKHPELLSLHSVSNLRISPEQAAARSLSTLHVKQKIIMKPICMSVIIPCLIPLECPALPALPG